MDNYWINNAKELSIGVNYTYNCRVEGDIIELGVFQGRTSVGLAAAVANLNSRFCNGKNKIDVPKKLWLLDSFEGLPDPVGTIDEDSFMVKNNLWAAGKLKAKGFGEKELGRIISRYLARDDYHIVKGWFKDSLEQMPSGVKFH